MLKILIAPNAFKHGLDAGAAAHALADGLRASALTCDCTCFPVADGGDGTGALIMERMKGERVPVEVHDPMGRLIAASFGLIDNGSTAVIEMADASGLRLLTAEERKPLQAHSAGTGELIRAALDRQVKKIILGVGGSATVDGGAGILSALGVRFLDKRGHVLPPAPQALLQLDRIDTTQLHPGIGACRIHILCDVNNFLLGEAGAAAVFGPQKGATAHEVKILEDVLGLLDSTIANVTGKKMSAIERGGAAGGVAAGLYAMLGAELVNGIDYFLTLCNFDEALDWADVVITGEGSIDQQTLHGKGPFGVAVRAKGKKLPVIAVAGNIALGSIPALREWFDVLLPINTSLTSLPEAVANTGQNLFQAGCTIGQLLALQVKKF